MSEELTVDRAEFQAIYKEVLEQRETQKKREELSDQSFRDWLLGVLKAVLEGLGYTIRGLYEFVMDVGYVVKEGFMAGMEQARINSYRYKDRGS